MYRVCSKLCNTILLGRIGAEEGEGREERRGGVGEREEERGKGE